jgi:AraC-like DNA-binding protein
MLGGWLDVSKAAFRVGYESLSRFSRDYQRMFGASPPQCNGSP